MGATVFTAQAVEVIQTPTGPGFILFEETYEKNVHPHDPSWDCVGLGRREDVLNIIFRHAHVCEGGLLKGRGGDITPEGYVGRWQKALQKAYAIEAREVRISIKDRSSSIEEEERARIADIEDCPLSLQQRAAWNAGLSLKLDLAQDFDALAWLCRTGLMRARKIRGLRPCDWIPSVDMLDQVFAQRSGKEPPMVLPRLVRLFDRQEGLFEINDQGELIKRGWSYSFVGSFVARYAQTELAEPGWFARRFKAMRAAARSAPILDWKGVLLRPFAPEGSSQYQLEDAQRLQAQYPNGVLLSEVQGSSDQYHLSDAPGFRSPASLVSLYEQASMLQAA